MANTVVFTASALLSAAVLLSAALAADIEVNIEETLSAKVTSLQHGQSDLVNFSVEIYNTGGFPYLARPRIDIVLPDGGAFTAWGDERRIQPGARSVFDMFWFTNATGKFPATLRYYFGGETGETDFVVEKSGSGSPPSVFSVRDFRTYDGYVVFDVSSSVEATGVVVMPQNYPAGWVFEQRKVGRMGPSASRTVILPYSGAYFPTDVGILVASDSGGYATSAGLRMEKEPGLNGVLHAVQDGLKIAFSGAR
jgi:hypothetical protein